MGKFKNTLLLISFLYIGTAQAQESTYTSGGNATGSGGTIEYSLGQLVFNENSDGTYTVSQGIQQAYEISNSLSLENYKSINLQVSAFPNPTTDYLMLSFNQSNNVKLDYQLFGADGKILETKKNLDINETINMERLNSAIYYLNILEDNMVIKTFKIIKN